MLKVALLSLASAVAYATGNENTTEPFPSVDPERVEVGAYTPQPASPADYVASAMDLQTTVNNPTTPFNCGGVTTAHLYNYESVGSTSDGTRICAIGGTGGSPFQFHRHGSTVKTLQVWMNKESSREHFHCMRVTFFNNNVEVVGNCPNGSPEGEFTFASGERVVGDVILSGNGIGTRVAYMKFSTSNGREFEVGCDENQHYYMRSHSGYLSGFFGRRGNSIDLLGLQFIKPLLSERLMDVTYPTLDSVVAPNAPTTVTSITACNLANTTRQISITKGYSMVRGESYSFTTRSTFSFGREFSVTSKVPRVAEYENGYKWTATDERSMTRTAETRETFDTSATHTLNVPALTISAETLTQWDEFINLPYNALYEIITTDNQRALFPSDGTYTGVYVSNIVVRFEPDRPIDTGTAECDGFANPE